MAVDEYINFFLNRQAAKLSLLWLIFIFSKCWLPYYWLFLGVKSPRKPVWLQSGDAPIQPKHTKVAPIALVCVSVVPPFDLRSLWTHSPFTPWVLAASELSKYSKVIFKLWVHLTVRLCFCVKGRDGQGAGASPVICGFLLVRKCHQVTWMVFVVGGSLAAHLSLCYSCWCHWNAKYQCMPLISFTYSHTKGFTRNCRTYRLLLQQWRKLLFLWVVSGIVVCTCSQLVTVLIKIHASGVQI